MKIAIFPGSFDPVHQGHKSIYEKASKLFDEVIIYITSNDEKQNQTSIQIRKRNIVAMFPNTKIIAGNKLTALVAKENGAIYIVRGLRTIHEVEYERIIATINKKLSSNLETVMIFADNDLKNVSSSLLREVKNRYVKDIEKLKINK